MEASRAERTEILAACAAGDRQAVSRLVTLGDDIAAPQSDAVELLPLDWSSDGQYILAKIRWPGRPDHVLLVSVEGSLRLVPGLEGPDL